MQPSSILLSLSLVVEMGSDTVIAEYSKCSDRGNHKRLCENISKTSKARVSGDTSEKRST